MWSQYFGKGWSQYFSFLEPLIWVSLTNIIRKCAKQSCNTSFFIRHEKVSSRGELVWDKRFLTASVSPQLRGDDRAKHNDPCVNFLDSTHTVYIQVSTMVGSWWSRYGKWCWMYSLVLWIILSSISLSQSLASGSISMQTSGNLHPPEGPNCDKKINLFK